MAKKHDWVSYGLMVLVVVGAYFLGVYKTRYEILTKGKGETQVGEQKQAPTEEEVKTNLSEEEWKKVVANPVAVKGREDAPVTIVEFTDYQCPFCRRYFDEAYKKIISDYVETGKVRYLVHDLPLPFHENADEAAVAARCAGKEGKYWEMHDKLFEKQEEWQGSSEVKAALARYGKEVGVDISDCQDDEEVAGEVRNDVSLANEVGATGTPTFFINGRLLVGAQPYESFKTMIEEELK